MKNVSIYGKKWLDLVFEGKNKEYGAYQLRQENSKTSAFAFLSGTLFLAGFVFLLSSFNEKEIPAPVTEPMVITPVDFIEPPIIESEPKTEEPKSKSEPATPEVVIPTGPMVVTVTPQATDIIPTNSELPTTPTSPTGSPDGTAPPTTTNIGGGGGTSPLPAAPTGPLKPAELDRQPTYPGGIKNFYQYVGDNFDKNNLDEGETIRVRVSFVIEKNGTMTDIRLLEKTNSTVDKEAIRVLKSLRTKWAPGFKNGEPVRTQFTLPITVLL
jgi:protein TonB